MDLEKIKKSKIGQVLKNHIINKSKKDSKKSLKKILNEIAESDINRLKHTNPVDNNGVRYSWDEKRGIFVGIDESGKEWVYGADTDTPAFWHYCPKVVKHNSKGYPVYCRTPMFALITKHGDEVTCPKCGTKSTIDIKVPKESKAYVLAEMLNQEG